MMSDLISREEAISALCHTLMPITAIRELPAVDAIPVEWLRKIEDIASMERDDRMFVEWLIDEWRKW